MRALDVLREVDVIAAEDTRHSQKLMQHYGITTRLMSVHEHNEQQRASQLIERLQQNNDIALISDAGTPLISDPGYTLVKQCRRANIPVVALPGPCAAITALSGAGLPTDRFVFEGFLPVKQQARLQQLSRLHSESATCVFYESPRRILDTVKMVVEVLGDDRSVVLAKELTKTFETYFSGEAGQAVEWLAEDANHQRGEFVLMIGGVSTDNSEVSDEAMSLLSLLMKELPLKKAAAITASQFDLKKNTLYQIGLNLQDKA